ncbi:MAG: PrsW family intramembrane metalloprotease [Oscillospiraceae bacterium]|nr:PrsW family intramembrane metalloprotease [Oscillospiraceae bacterium]
MFYFLLPMFFSYNYILVAAAIIPAAFLMVKVYRSDRVEKESPAMLRKLVIGGVLSALIAIVAERALSMLLGMVAKGSGAYDVLLYFVVVACSEEGAKYFMLRRYTWNSPEFDCQYDGVVYAVFVSLGFAIWENISYVVHYGFSTAIVRALTAIPGHACFGVFMGVFYGIARRYANKGAEDSAKAYRVLAVLIPVLLHGAYDYIASSNVSGWYFVIFIAALFAVSFSLVTRMSRQDKYI